MEEDMAELCVRYAELTGKSTKEAVEEVTRIVNVIFFLRIGDTVELSESYKYLQAYAKNNMDVEQVMRHAMQLGSIIFAAGLFGSLGSLARQENIPRAQALVSILREHFLFQEKPAPK